MVVLEGLEVAGKEEFLNVYRVSIGEGEQFWRWMVAKVNVLNATELYT